MKQTKIYHSKRKIVSPPLRNLIYKSKFEKCNLFHKCSFALRKFSFVERWWKSSSRFFNEFVSEFSESTLLVIFHLLSQSILAYKLDASRMLIAINLSSITCAPYFVRQLLPPIYQGDISKFLIKIGRTIYWIVPGRLDGTLFGLSF